MAFVAFGKKKVINAPQQLQQLQPSPNDQPQLLRSDERRTATASCQQQQCTDASAPQSIAQSDLEGFRLAEAEADTRFVFREETPDEVLSSYESRGNAQTEELMETQTDGISKLLEQNVALRRNFDTLKQLHLHLAEANAQLQEAFLKMQAEKARVESGLIHQHEKETLESELKEMKAKHAKELETLRAEREQISGIAVEFEQRNRFLKEKVVVMKGDNKELNQKLEVVRYGHHDRLEKDQALNSKHAAELEYARELSLVKVEDQNYRQQAADLAHKCKHLEVDLEKAIQAGDTLHQQLVSLTYEKDATIMDLEQDLRRFKDNLREREKKRKDNQRSWLDERHKLQAVVDKKERDEYKLKATIQEEAEQKLKESFREIVELRTLLNALEKSSAAAESRHLEALQEMKKEREAFRKELAAAMAAQKEATDRLIDMERLRVQLADAHAQNRECVSQAAEYRKTIDEVNKKMELMRLELAEAVTARGKEQAEHTVQLQNLERRWAAEKCALLRREDKLVKASKEEFCCKYRTLKKRSKHTSKRLAALTIDHNQLTVRLRECEAQLAIAQMTRFHVALGSGPSRCRTSSLKAESLGRGSFEADMKDLADRQAKFLAQSAEPPS